MSKKKVIVYSAAALFGIGGALVAFMPDAIFGRAEYEGLSGIGEGLGRLFYGGASIAVSLIFLTFGILERSTDGQPKGSPIHPFVLLLVGIGFVLYAYFGYIQEWDEMIGFLSAGAGAIFLGLGFVNIFSKRLN